MVLLVYNLIAIYLIVGYKKNILCRTGGIQVYCQLTHANNKFDLKNKDL